MKGLLTMTAVALLILILYGALSSFLPSHLLPDLGFMLVIGLALSIDIEKGLLLAAVLGYITDFLSVGSLTGQHAFLYVIACGTTRVVSQQLNLRRRVHLVCFAAILTVAEALALGGIGLLLVGQPATPIAISWALLARGAVNGIFTPFVTAGVDWLVVRLGEEEGPRSLLQFRVGGERS